MNPRIPPFPFVACTLLLLCPCAQALVDTDTDGMGDIWENAQNFHIGANPPAGQLPGDDPDSDGFPNLAESRAGTDPGNAASFPSFLFSFTPPVYEAADPVEGAPQPEDPSDPNYIPPPPGPAPALIDPPVSTLTWPTVPGKTYHPVPSEDLVTWSQATSTFFGEGISQTMESETLYPDGTVPPKLFWRVEINDTDTDEDGLTDYEELHIPDPNNPAKTLDPNDPDTDGDGLPDGAEYTPGTNGLAAFTNTLLTDPDGSGLPVSLDTDLLGRWDLEATHTAPAPGPYYTLARYADSTAAARHIVPFYTETKLDGIPSKAAGVTPSAVGFLCPPRTLLHNRTTYSVSLWARIEKDSLTSSRPIAALFSHHRRLPKDAPYQAQYKIDINGMWIERLANGTHVLKAGTSNFINYTPGTNQQVNGTWTFNGVSSAAKPAGTLDDGRWHHYLAVRTSGSVTLYLDGEPIGSNSNVIIAAINATNETKTGISLGRYYGEPAEDGLPYTDPQAAKASFDRVRVWSRTLTAADAQGLFKQDADKDGLWDITEERTRKWDDHNGNAIPEPGEFAFLATPLHSDPPQTDHDDDFISSLDEQNLTQTDIAKRDTDGDQLPDGYERTHPPLDPKVPDDGSADPDLDGLTTAQEYAGGVTNPFVADVQLYPPTWISLERSLRYDYDDYGVSQPTVPKTLSTAATWPGAVPTAENLTAIIPFNLLHTTLPPRQPFPGNFPANNLSPDLSAGGNAQSIPSPDCYHASLTARRIIVKLAAPATEAREFKAILVTERTVNEALQTPTTSLITLTVPAGQKESAPYDLIPAFTGVGTGAYSESVDYKVFPTEIDFITPESENWEEVMPEGRVVLRDEKTKIRIRIRGISYYATQLYERTGLEGLYLKTNLTRAGFPEVFLAFTDRRCSVIPNPNFTEIRYQLSKFDLSSLNLLPSSRGAELIQHSALDLVAGIRSNFSDSQAFLDRMAAGLQGMPSGYANNKEGTSLSSAPPQSMPHKSFMQAAGAEVLTARIGPMSKLGMVMNQGEIFYFSGHGYPGRRDDGGPEFQISLTGNDVKGVDLKKYWNEDLRVVVIAGCSVVNVNNWNPNPGEYEPALSGPNEGYYPGEFMNDVGPRFILGYGSKAPSDDQNTDLIATTFVDQYLQNPDDPFSAWRNANDNPNGRNATALERKTRYGYFEAVVGGVPSLYKWELKDYALWKR